MDYFDPSAGKARLAVVKYQATAPDKKGTLFVNPGTVTTRDGRDEISYVEAPQVDQEGPALSSSLPWELISAHTFEDNTILSLGTLVVSAPIRCEFSFPLPNHTPKSLPRSCDVNHLCLSLICWIQYIETLVLMILPPSHHLPAPAI